MQNMRDAGQEGCSTGRMQDRRDSEKEGCRKGEMQDRKIYKILLDQFGTEQWQKKIYL